MTSTEQRFPATDGEVASILASPHDPRREIMVSRTIDAPPDIVFEVWTDPAHISEWWGPRGFSTTTHEWDLRPGGVWRFTMHGPDGTDYPNRIVFVEVDRPRRLVYRHTGVEETQTQDVRFLAAVTFADLGGRTEVTLRMIFETPEELDAVARFGAVEGAHDTLARFGEAVARLTPGAGR